MGLGTNKSMSGLIIPIVLLVITLLLTTGLYGYNSYLEGENTILDTRIVGSETDMKEVQEDANLQIFDLITTNQEVIDTLKSYSQITSFIAILQDMEKKYSIEFSGFNFANGIISTEVSTLSENSIEAYRIISSFIYDYRVDEKADFRLPFVTQVSGTTQMKMSVNLEVKEGFKKSNQTTQDIEAPTSIILDSSTEEADVDVPQENEVEEGFSTSL